MFVRKKKSSQSDRISIQIVENRRIGSKVSQKVLRHVGSAKHDQEVQHLIDLAEEIMQRMLHESSPLFSKLPFTSSKSGKINEDFDDVSLKSLTGDKSFNCGISEVFGKLYDDLGFSKLFGGQSAALNNRILKNCVLARLAAPTSKRKATKTLATEFGVRMHVDKIYRMMDQLDSNKVKQTIRNATLGILRHKVNILFYDVTTLYFESFTPDELRSFGFSKDSKSKETQIVIALITSTEGLPITYETFPGRTHEIRTLLPVIKKLAREFEVESVDFAADRGMFSAANLVELERAGINYVVGAKLRSMDKVTKAAILAIHAQQQKGEDSYQEREVTYDGRRLVISYNPIMAAKDKKERQRLLARLDKLANKDGKVAMKDVIKNNGSKRYLQLDAEKKTARIRREKATSEAAWDGVSGYITNSAKPAGEIIANYRRLWEIETAFRLCKHDLKMRPIFHRKGDRIKAHLDICFITYALGRQLMYRYHLQQGKKASYDVLREALAETEFSRLRHIKSGDLYGVPMSMPPIAKKLYRLVGLKHVRTPFKL